MTLQADSLRRELLARIHDAEGHANTELTREITYREQLATRVTVLEHQVEARADHTTAALDALTCSVVALEQTTRELKAENVSLRGAVARLEQEGRR